MTESKWDFDGGLLPLDFANTAEWHASPEPLEKLGSYSDLVDWSRSAGVLTAEEALALEQHAQAHPAEAQLILTQAIAIRETIYRIFSSLADRQAPSTIELTKLNHALAEAMSHLQVTKGESGFDYTWGAEGADLSRPLWPILQSAAELLTSEDLNRVGECADNRGCGYLFYDTSRNHSRRWCSMESCGNRAKARRHYQRSKDQFEPDSPTNG